jgi:hypothetical protein
VEWQDKFYDHMAEEFPLLERGESTSVTKRKHVPTWLFKQANRLTEEMSAIQNIGAFNSGKQKEQILKMLLEWYPQINAFESKLKPYEQHIKILEGNQRVIENQSRSKDARVYYAEQETQNLSYQLQEYLWLHGKIFFDIERQHQVEFYRGTIQFRIEEIFYFPNTVNDCVPVCMHLRSRFK